MQCSHQIGYYPALWKRDNRIYLKKPGKDNYHVEKSYRSISISNILGKVFERIILKEATNILTENGFLENKNLYAYQKNKNAPQALLPLVEQMHTCITEGKFGIAVMADLQGAFDAVWRDGAIYKLHQAGIKGNLLSLFGSFLEDRYSRNMVNSHTSEWFETKIGVPQGSILSPLIFIIYTADLTTNDPDQADLATIEPNQPNEPYQSNEEPNESKYADDLNFWRIHHNIYQLHINVQLGILNLQIWCSKWRLSINTSKTQFMLFYNKKKTYNPHVNIVINEVPIQRVPTKKVLGITLDENITFTPHIEYITQSCKKACNKLTPYPNLTPALAKLLYKAFIRSKLEYGCSIWGYKIYQGNHLSTLESAQRTALNTILRPLRSTPTDALESELAVEPIDLRIEELQRNEAVKLLQKKGFIFQRNLLPSHTPANYLASLAKQLLTQVAQEKKCSLDIIELPDETPSSHQTFDIQNLEVTMPSYEKPENEKEKNEKEQQYITEILQLPTKKSMIFFTDGSAISNPGAIGAGLVVHKNGFNQRPVKKSTTISSHGYSFEAEITAINIATKYAIENLDKENDKIFFYTDSQSAISAIISQSLKHHHDKQIATIRTNLQELSPKVESINIIYSPAHKNIKDNESADQLAKLAAKRAKHLPPNPEVSQTNIVSTNKLLTVTKWERRWTHTKRNNYKDLVPTISKDSIRQRHNHLKFTSRKAACKILRLKSTHSMLNGHRSKFDEDTNANCESCNVKETPYHFIMECTLYDTEREKLFKTINTTIQKSKIKSHELTYEIILGEHLCNQENSKQIRKALETYLDKTKKKL